MIKASYKSAGNNIFQTFQYATLAKEKREKKFCTMVALKLVLFLCLFGITFAQNNNRQTTTAGPCQRENGDQLLDTIPFLNVSCLKNNYS